MHRLLHPSVASIITNNPTLAPDRQGVTLSWLTFAARIVNQLLLFRNVRKKISTQPQHQRNTLRFHAAAGNLHRATLAHATFLRHADCDRLRSILRIILSDPAMAATGFMAFSVVLVMCTASRAIATAIESSDIHSSPEMRAGNVDEPIAAPTAKGCHKVDPPRAANANAHDSARTST
jgi:hypothetical protein